MYNMDKEYTLSKDFEGISMSVNIIQCGKREARLKLVRTFCLAAMVKQEYAPDAPAIYGIRPVKESDGVEIWQIPSNLGCYGKS